MPIIASEVQFRLSGGAAINSDTYTLRVQGDKAA